MTPTTAIYLHQSSNSSGSWVEEWMNVEVYQSKCGREGIERLWYFISCHLSW